MGRGGRPAGRKPKMSKYIAKRVLLMVPTLFGAAVLVFFLLRLIPGDICELRMAGTGGYFDEEALEICRQEIGLTDPLIVQFLDWIGGFLRFDLGTSMWTGRPITQEIALRFELSLEVAILATVTATVLAIPLGTISAIKQDTWIDYAVRTFSIAGIAMPSFWLGILIILGLLIGTQSFFGEPWMPPIRYTPIWVDPWANLSQLIWPAVATGYRYSAVATRMTRSAMLEVLREDYIRTARAKGLLETVIVNRHALKNAMLPVITVIGLEFAFLMGGLVVTEQVFNLNGLGKLFVEAVINHDYTLTQSLVMLVALVFILTNFVVDILYAWLDPRIRYG
jgi:peptide/nickel transport system permease protein